MRPPKTRYMLPVYQSAQLLECQSLNPDTSKPVRYYPVDLEIRFWRKLWLLLRQGKWVAFERRFRPVYPGGVLYEEAPYEAIALDKPMTDVRFVRRDDSDRQSL